MYLTGMVDKRTLEKYEREAKEKNRETWYLSWCMDTNSEGMTISRIFQKNIYLMIICCFLSNKKACCYYDFKNFITSWCIIHIL